MRIGIPLQARMPLPEEFQGLVIDLLLQHAGRLPLEGFCQKGGWPDDDSIALQVLSLRSDTNGCTAIVEVRFNERISTGCSSMRNNTNASGRLVVRLDVPGKELQVDALGDEDDDRRG